MFSEEEKIYYMEQALDQATYAESIGEVPIGAVIVHEGKIIGKGYNRRETDNLASAHAEMMAIEEANKYLKNWRIEDSALFVTLEPCTMCSGAIVLSRINEVYYGAADLKGGMAGSLLNLLQYEPLNHQCEVEGGILGEQSGEMISEFFKKIRENKKKNKK